MRQKPERAKKRRMKAKKGKVEKKPAKEMPRTSLARMRGPMRMVPVPTAMQERLEGRNRGPQAPEANPDPVRRQSAALGSELN